MPEVTPAPVMMLPSVTTFSATGTAPSAFRCSSAAQWLVARRPLSSPAAPKTSEPVQTEVTYFAARACRRRNSSTSSSSIRSCWPGPPGTMMRSSCGQSANVTVGKISMPRSVFTGARLCATRCTLVFGTRASTSYGPVMSSWVNRGKISIPISRSIITLSAASAFRARDPRSASSLFRVCRGVSYHAPAPVRSWRGPFR